MQIMKIPRKQMEQAENEVEREDSSVLSMTELSLLRNYYALAPSRSKLSLRPQKMKRPCKEMNEVDFFQAVLLLVSGQWFLGYALSSQRQQQQQKKLMFISGFPSPILLIIFQMNEGKHRQVTA